ncbi:hypothetical protein [Methylomicrobium sp. Wu6]|uniref:hypothetical protein n=1 Tax=Methylomicrobium sp. Wu6 TaxID=3107928 RepID=UPI002DD64BCB|nr:hypothetical protein [Methylomicrobium sp. Wu6]MEC4749729.1 hypothetical protein [Methylomicrobium sp. Wu6]
MEEVEFRIMFRKPEYPVLIVSPEKLYSAINLRQLAEICVSLSLAGSEIKLRVIDSTGSEFWYLPREYILSPGFVTKKWSKKKVIETFNNSVNARESNQEYSMRSLSSKKLEKIILDICGILNYET